MSRWAFQRGRLHLAVPSVSRLLCRAQVATYLSFCCVHFVHKGQPDTRSFLLRSKFLMPLVGKPVGHSSDCSPSCSFHRVVTTTNNLLFNSNLVTYISRWLKKNTCIVMVSHLPGSSAVIMQYLGDKICISISALVEGTIWTFMQRIHVFLTVGENGARSLSSVHDADTSGLSKTCEVM